MHLGNTGIGMQRSEFKKENREGLGWTFIRAL